MADLLPCPFCGCTKIREDDNGESGWLVCDDCGATGPYSPDDMAANLSIEQAWNKRLNALTPAQAAGLAAGTHVVVPVKSLDALEEMRERVAMQHAQAFSAGWDKALEEAEGIVMARLGATPDGVIMCSAIRAMKRENE